MVEIVGRFKHPYVDLFLTGGFGFSLTSNGLSHLVVVYLQYAGDEPTSDLPLILGTDDALDVLVGSL